MRKGLLTKSIIFIFFVKGYIITVNFILILSTFHIFSSLLDNSHGKPKYEINISNFEVKFLIVKTFHIFTETTVTTIAVTPSTTSSKQQYNKPDFETKITYI